LERKFKLLFLAFVAFGLPQADTNAQNAPLDAYDAFYLEPINTKGNIERHFSQGARVSTMIYDSAGNSQNITLTPKEYDEQLFGAATDFMVTRTPEVLIYRSYEDLASVYSSVKIDLVDRESGESYSTFSVQSMKLARKFDDWYITHLSIQNESPIDPFPTHLLQDRSANQPSLPAEPREGRVESSISDAPYDANVVYHLRDVDEPPVYPGDATAYSKFLAQYQITTIATSGYTPFLITIGEDGLASLSYAHDLSGFQITRAESFVRSMLIWYPAIKDAASVKCKLILYIHD
jgi:hypothetical protein